MDGMNYNWCLLQGSLNLAFSYMTFVMQDKIERNDPAMNRNRFDLEAYNYIVNKTNYFYDNQAIVQRDHETLLDVLSNFERCDPTLIESLHLILRYDKKDGGNKKNYLSVLELAINSGNTRSIDIILLYMARIPYNASRFFCKLFKDLIEVKGLQDYLGNLLQQTDIMIDKRVFITNQPYNEEIVAIGLSNTLQIQQSFYS